MPAASTLLHPPGERLGAAGAQPEVADARPRAGGQGQSRRFVLRLAAQEDARRVAADLAQPEHRGEAMSARLEVGREQLDVPEVSDLAEAR